MSSSNVFIALLHYPVYNKKGAVVTTSVTNMDIHDIARSARTFGISNFYIVTPLEQQRDFITRILNHWKKGYGSIYNPARKEAFDIIMTHETIDGVMAELKAKACGKHVYMVTTSASPQRETIAYHKLRNTIQENNGIFLIVFGTGWGVTAEIIEKADFLLEPIKGTTSYNHLSVRSAVAISLDRLLGKQ